MVDDDAPRFAAMLRDVFGLYPAAKPITEGQLAMFFRALARYSLEQVAAGFDAHVKDAQRGRFAPLPADVIAQLEVHAENDGRPGPEEAWAIAVSSRSEWETVVWTPECAQAMAVAQPLVSAGDEIGARMAFKESYKRLVDSARATGDRAQWIVAEGWDQDRRSLAIAAAVEAGRLPRSELEALPAPNTGSIAGLLSGPKGGVPDGARARIAAAIERIKAREDGPQSDGMAAVNHTQELKDASARLVAEYERKQREAEKTAQHESRMVADPRFAAVVAGSRVAK